MTVYRRTNLPPLQVRHWNDPRRQHQTDWKVFQTKRAMQIARPTTEGEIEENYRVRHRFIYHKSCYTLIQDYHNSDLSFDSGGSVLDSCTKGKTSGNSSVA